VTRHGHSVRISCQKMAGMISAANLRCRGATTAPKTERFTIGEEAPPIEHLAEETIPDSNLLRCNFKGLSGVTSGISRHWLVALTCPRQ
jgi:hypothetical protein